MAESESDRTAEEAREAAESQADLQRGDLPLQAERRLAQETGAHPLFTSDLSVDEFLLIRSQRFVAAGQVLGSSVYHMGFQWISSWIGGELAVITRAHMHARELAMGRMLQEARALKAQGVVGVRLTTKNYEWGTDLLEFSAIGTAVRVQGMAPPEHPFLSDLSGEDFWTLLRSGYVPRGLAMGFCSFFAAWSRGQYGWQNQELLEFSAAVYKARSLAMQRLGQDVSSLGADGVVGVKVETTKYPIEMGQGSPPGMRVDFLALGTAIAHAGGQETVPAPTLIMNMTGVRPMRARSGQAELQHR